MKKKLTSVVLPVSAALALTGTGFGMWVFNETSNVYTGASIQVTQAVASEALTVTENNVEIVLDQFDAVTTDADYFVLKTDFDFEVGGLLDGKVVSAADADDITTGEEWTEDSAKDENVKISYEIKMTFTGNVEKYIELTGMGVLDAATSDTGCVAGTLGNSNGTTDFKFENTVKVNSADNYTLTKVFPTFNWKTGAKPTTLAAYRTMKADIAASKVLFEISTTDAVLA